jgi:hypothetical protein
VKMTEAEAGGRTLLSRMLGPYGVLRGNRDLTLLFCGQVVSSFGDWLYILALVVLAYDLTGSATLVAALTFVRLLPYALFLPFSGVLADRGNRKALMIFADLGRGACMLGLLFVGSEEALWIAFPLVFLATAFSSLFKPAMSSVLPTIVGEEDLVKANGIWSQKAVEHPVVGEVHLHCLLPYLVRNFTGRAGVQVEQGDYRARLGKTPGNCPSDSRIVQLAIPRQGFSASEKRKVLASVLV